jgi:hypothetical protein
MRSSNHCYHQCTARRSSKADWSSRQCLKLNWDKMHYRGLTQIHPKPHNDAIKQWVHLTHLLFSCAQGRLRMYLHMISTFIQRVYCIVLQEKRSVKRESGKHGWRSGKTLASRHCDLGFDSSSVMRKLSLSLILSRASRVFLRSSSPSKNQHS